MIIGNEKGGSGKSTTAMHIIIGLLAKGYRVTSIDLDVRQSSLSRYIANRRTYCSATGKDVSMPTHLAALRSSVVKISISTVRKQKSD